VYFYISDSIVNNLHVSETEKAPDKKIQNETNPQMFLSSTQVQEYKPYSCEAHNPVSKDKSESTPISCKYFLFHAFHS